MSSLVSICIPAYKQPELLKRCLKSIVIQSYKQVEVLISDDTPNNEVQSIVNKYAGFLNISYRKNQKPLGSPENWNAALMPAKGDYVLLLHHDDFFSSPSSLEQFVKPFQRNSTIDFVFGSNSSIEKLPGNKINHAFFLKYYECPFLLLTGNFIGAPSNVMLKATSVKPYNTKYKWIVDIEFYIRLFLEKKHFYYINKKLVEIGIHEGQISNECVDNTAVLLFENISYAAESNLKIDSIHLYDFYWRLLRNAKIFSLNQIIDLGVAEEEIPVFIKRIVRRQFKLPSAWLHNPIISKAFMSISYLIR